MFILRLEKFSRENDAAELSGVSFSAVSVLCGLWVGLDYWKATADALIARTNVNTAYLIDDTANFMQNTAQAIDINLASPTSNIFQVRL